MLPFGVNQSKTERYYVVYLLIDYYFTVGRSISISRLVDLRQISRRNCAAGTTHNPRLDIGEINVIIAV